jgi:hypothetical protein
LFKAVVCGAGNKKIAPVVNAEASRSKGFPALLTQTFVQGANDVGRPALNIPRRNLCLAEGEEVFDAAFGKVVNRQPGPLIEHLSAARHGLMRKMPEAYQCPFVFLFGNQATDLLHDIPSAMHGNSGAPDREAIATSGT